MTYPNFIIFISSLFSTASADQKNLHCGAISDVFETQQPFPLSTIRVSGHCSDIKEKPFTVEVLKASAQMPLSINARVNLLFRSTCVTISLLPFIPNTLTLFQMPKQRRFANAAGRSESLTRSGMKPRPSHAGVGNVFSCADVLVG
jgi:hypothetical protein